MRRRDGDLPAEVTDQLSNADISTARRGELSVDAVVSVCQDSVEDNVAVPNDHISLADEPHDTYLDGECTYEVFEEAADSVLSRLRDGEEVLVHCHAGISRSTSVSAAALAVYEDRAYHEALGQVRAARAKASPVGELHAFAQRYVIENRGE